MTTIPKGALPAGRTVGEEESSLRLPPLTVNPLMVCEPVPTIQSVCPSGASRASSAPREGVENGVLPSKVSVPLPAIEYREMLLLAVLTAKR